MNRKQTIILTEEELDHLDELGLIVRGLIELAESNVMETEEPTIQKDRFCALLRPIADGIEEIYCAVNDPANYIKDGTARKAGAE